MSDALIIIPTYNEKENVERMTRKVMSLEKSFDLLFIDDASPDGTATIIKTLMNEFPNRIFIEERKGKLGLGTAYIHGFKWAITHQYDYIFEMDCDFSHNPDDLIRLYNACAIDGADFSIGSRYIHGGKVENWPMRRLLLSYFASVYVRLILLINIRDTTAGFKCYKRKVLETINLDGNTFKGYAFQICMKFAALKHGFKAIEVPITFVDRIYGESKMSSGIFKEAFFGVWKMRRMKL
ncbi:MAG: polyprenol monophosphomannose synthase [Crocinitomicaceae bacterium]|nr:polyprenol monophosphomannose synthase [Crocinitomicaceae bacterium]